MQNYLRHHLPAIIRSLFWLGLALTTLLLLIELAPSHSGWEYKDKVQHILGFFVLTGFGLLSYKNKPQQISIGLAAYGLLMEILQGVLTIYRTASFYDWLADCIGICLSLIIFIAIKNTRLIKPSV